MEKEFIYLGYTRSMGPLGLRWYPRHHIVARMLDDVL